MMMNGYALAADLPPPAVLCPYELSSLRSLVTYIAHNRDLREDVVEHMVAARFNVAAIAELARADFHHAVSFLVDLRHAGTWSRR